MVKLLSELAPAKLNLFLRVVGRRASDGYHLLDSLFVPITLADRIRLDLRPASRRMVTLACDAPTLPTDERNLAVCSALAFMTEFEVDAEIAIDLHKEIPAGAGLGGGSSDAGTVLRMMALLCHIDSVDRLAAVALKLGADVPFFLNPVPARVGGIGELISPLSNMADFGLVVAVPPFEVATADVFRELKPENWSGPAPDTNVESIVAGKISSALMVNDLATVAVSRWPEIGRLLSILEAAGATASAMTGSGGAVFGVFPTYAAACQAAPDVKRMAPDAQVLTASLFRR
jgi:4-diphosphocytidyl-2-C-methyl-D-erythritol kinase